MSLTRVSTDAFRKLSIRSNGCRSYGQVQQPTCKVEQQVGVGQTRTKSKGWAIPAALAVVGLGVSTFSTQQLVSSNDSIKMLSATTIKK